jgi:methionyl-tRNA formyltransferase
MKVVLIGQQDFAKAVLDALIARGDTVAGVFCAPQAPGARPDPLRLAAAALGLPLFQFPSLRAAPALQAIASLDADIGIMAYVVQFVPQDFVNVPRLGTIQYHPSLLPRYRGPSAINWAIIRGETETGLTIFRPSDGLDEGPVLLQKRIPIGPDDTLGSVYFDHLFPMGVTALLEAADLVVAGKAQEAAQDESQAHYEGWCRAPEAQIHWHTHADLIYNLIRGCDPAPGAWTTLRGKQLHVFEARKHPTRSFHAVRGKPGECLSIGPESVLVSAQGGQIEIRKVRGADGRKVAAAHHCAELGLGVGDLLGGS